MFWHAAATGFAASEDTEVDVTAARRDPVNITLRIAAIESQVKVSAETPLSTDTNNNANQQVLSGKDLDALPDDPDELAAALQALAERVVAGKLDPYAAADELITAVTDT